MLKELSFLIKLQNIDNQLRELDLEKGDLPEQIVRLDAAITHCDTKITESDASLIDISQQLKQIDINTEQARERLKKSQSVIYSVKTTREYDAISSEIEQAKTQISENEHQNLELLAREEDLQKLLKAEHEKLRSIKNEYQERSAEMQERMDYSQDEELHLIAEREILVQKLKKPIYAHYERIRKIRDGVGLSFILDEACSYCFSRIPHQRQAEVRRMDELILCEVCGCILVSDEFSAQLQRL
ncbi:MAG: C4-type zinc ribbon domain-containing protein [Calditrichota bacterium]